MKCGECGFEQAGSIQGNYNYSKIECDKCYYQNSSAYEIGVV